jgi:flagellar hook-length control protein FliK
MATSSTSGTFAAEQSAADSTAKDVPIADQLATVLAPAAHQADGSYQVNIRLQPEELGVVNVALRLESGTVNVSLHAEGNATGDMLRQNLGQLRQQLTNAGLTTGSFDVSTGTGTASGQGGMGAGQQQSTSTMDGLSYEDPDPTETSGAANRPDISSATSGLLDVRL